MRRGMVIAGAVILVIGVAALGAGFYLLIDQAGLANLGVNAQKTSLVLAPGASSNIGTTMTGQITIVAYTDNVSSAIQVSSGGATPVARTASSGGATNYIEVFTNLGSSGSSSVVMHNNQTRTVAIQYAAVQTGLGALAYGGLSILGGGVLFIVGLIVLIVGLVLKRKVPPGTNPVPQ